MTGTLKPDLKAIADVKGQLDESPAGSNAEEPILMAKDLDDPLDPLFVHKETTKLSDLPPTQRAKRLFKSTFMEGHTAWDSLLSNANASVGQVIQVYPHQVALMGAIPALVIGFSTKLLNFYSLWLLVVLFLERKRAKVLADQWYETTDSHGYRRNKHVTQFHDLIGFSMGKVFFILAEVLVAISLFGTGIAQIVASSSSQYTLNKQFNKLEWGLILGPPLLIICLLPGFRSARVLNVIALTGTNYSCLFMFIYACRKGIKPGIFTRGPASLQNFFLGAATVGAGGHTYQIEMADAMRQSRKMTYMSFLSTIWNLMLLIPHSFALVLALPDEVTRQSNIYSVLPSSNFKTASVWLMYIHNGAAMSVHMHPLMFMWEKLIGVHHRHIGIRLLSRLPILMLLWLVALAIPFYGTINSLFSALTGGMTGYVLPCLAFNWYFRTQKRRDECASYIPKIFTYWNWKPIFLFNLFLVIFFFSTDTCMGIVFAVKQLVEDIDTFKIFATCYQCPKSKTG